MSDKLLRDSQRLFDQKSIEAKLTQPQSVDSHLIDVHHAPFAKDRNLAYGFGNFDWWRQFAFCRLLVLLASLCFVISIFGVIVVDL